MRIIKKLIPIIALLFSFPLFAQENPDRYLKLTMRDGSHISFLLKEYPKVCFPKDSISIVSKSTYAKAQLSQVRHITFTTDIDVHILNGNIVQNKYYRIKGYSGKYIDASTIHGKENEKKGVMSLKNAEECSIAGTIFYLDDNNRLLNYATGTYVDEEFNIGDINSTSARLDIKASADFSNKFIIKNCNSNTYMLDNNGESVEYSTEYNNSDNTFTIENVTHLPIEISDAGYATFYAAVAVELPEHITAHTITIDGERAVLSERITTIPAKTGVILVGNEGQYELAIAESSNYIESILEGTIADTYITGDAYVLAKADEGTGFYRAELNKLNNTAFVNNGHKAYLPIYNTDKAAKYVFGNPTTNIKSPQDDKETIVYDIYGRRINNITTSGIYIINNCKVFKE